MTKTIFFRSLYILMWIDYVFTLRILGVFPIPSHSHFIGGFRVMKELADRGHDVTLISSFPQKIPIKNLKDVALIPSTEGTDEQTSTILFNLENAPSYVSIFHHYQLGNTFTNLTYSAKEVQDLLKSNATFDIIVMEEFMSASLMGLSYYYNAHLIFLSTQGPNVWNNNLFGNPAPASYIPNLFTSYTSHMNFFQRIRNALIINLELLCRHLVYYPRENVILHQYLPSAPHLLDIIYNASIILLNSHVIFREPVPVFPNMIEVAGYHISEPKQLPKHLQEFLDAAEEGVIYFSMGSYLNSAYIPTSKKYAMIKAFSQIRHKVLWKVEDWSVSDLPENVKMQKWLPQQDILAHRNIKAFISHGGLLSTIESVYYGVPILGIPIFADQKLNVATAVEKGYAVALPFGEITQQTFLAALLEILNNSSYHKNVKQWSRILRDTPMKPLDLAVYWIEYVGRYGRCDHFRSAALDLAWYQKSMLDVAVCFIAILAVLCLAPYYIIKKIWKQKVKRQQEFNRKIKSK